MPPDADKSRETAYTGPLVVLTSAELAPLAELLHANPRPWNADLRRRMTHAEKMNPPPRAGSHSKGVGVETAPTFEESAAERMGSENVEESDRA